MIYKNKEREVSIIFSNRQTIFHRIQKDAIFIFLIGIALTALAFLTLWGCFDQRIFSIFNVSNNGTMVCNTALCFILSGLSLCLWVCFPRQQKKIFFVSGIIILFIAGLSLSQYLFVYSAGIDHLFVNRAQIDHKTFSGRMAYNSALSFIFVGICFLWMPYVKSRAQANVIQLIIFCVILLGLSAILGHALKLDFLYSWHSYSRMAIHTAVAIMLLGIGLWVVWDHYEKILDPYHDKEEQKILILSGFILLCIALIDITISFSVILHGLMSKLVILPQSKIYLIIQQKLEMILPFVFLAIAIGIYLLHWQISPLIRKVIASKKEVALSHERAQADEARFHAIFEQAAIRMALVSLDGKWLKVNESLCRLTGYTKEEMLKKDWQSITYPEDLATDLQYANEILLGKIKSYQMEKRFLCKNGGIVWAFLNVSLLQDKAGKPLYFISQIQNINDQKKAELQLKIMAFQDPLTGLENRTQLENHLNTALAVARRHHDKLAILYLDLDYFKRVNDAFGHDVGDELLKIIAMRIKNSIRATDFAARLGGDEFLIVLTDVKDLDIVKTLAEKIINAIKEPMKIKNHEILISTSIGISVYPEDGNDYSSLIKNADLALYQVKDKGRSHYQFWSKS